MPFGVVDVGSNTVRLLVEVRGRPVLSERESLRLGDDVERYGRITPEKLEEASEVVADYARDAKAAGVRDLEVLITSPGRQAENGEELLSRLEEASGHPTRILTSIEEGRLAFIGAVALAEPPARRQVAVVDVGGGSAQVVLGSRRDGPQWAKSIDLGSQRLTSRLLGSDPPGEKAIAKARAEAKKYAESLEPPRPRMAFAVGGSARALKRLVGPRLGPDELAEALEILATTPAAVVSREYGVDSARTRTLPAGAALLAALQARLETPLKVVRGGLRDGALSELETRQLAA